MLAFKKGKIFNNFEFIFITNFFIKIYRYSKKINSDALKRNVFMGYRLQGKLNLGNQK